MTNQELSPEALAVIEKVKKLLALAQGNANENEASAASAKAMELLAAYNLDMATVGDARTGSTQRVKEQRKGGLYGWQRSLWQAVCELNFCMYWSIRGTRAGQTYQHKVLGRKENVIGAEVMADYLQSAVERLAQEWAKDRGFASVFVREAIAYREGMAARLVERLQELRRQRLDDDARKQREQAAAARHPSATGGTGLVLASVIQSEMDANYDFMYGYEPGTTAARRAANAARQFEAQRAADEAIRQRDAAEAANPQLKADRLAREAKTAAANAKYWGKYFAKQANRAPRYRNMTSGEQRAAMPSFSDGYRKGNDIGLDKQVDRKNSKAIK